MKKKSVIRKMVTITGLIIAALFVILVELTVNTVDKSSRETADADISIMASSYSNYVTTWLDENLNLLDFYIKSDVVYDFGTYDEIGAWLATTPSRRSPEIDYVLFIKAEGNTYYDSGKKGNNSDRAYYKAIMAGAEYYITDPTVAKATGKVSIMLAKPAFDRSGRKVGMFVGVKTIDKIQQQINSFKLGEKGFRDGYYTINVDLNTLKVTIIPHIWLIGSAFSWGWTLGDAQEMTYTGDGAFTWSGHMYAEIFKFLVVPDDWWGYWRDASAADYWTATEDGTGDVQFQVPAEGDYNIAFNVLTKLVSLTPAE